MKLPTYIDLALSHGSAKQASLGKFMGTLANKAFNVARPLARTMGAVPQGKSFRDDPLRFARRALLAPDFGKFNMPIRVAQLGAVTYTGKHMYDGWNGMRDKAELAAEKVPHFPSNTGLRAWLHDIAESPARSMLSTAMNGVPYGVHPAQKQFVRDNVNLGLRHAVHHPERPSTWLDNVISAFRHVTGPAVTLASDGVLGTLPDLVAPPSKDEDQRALAEGALTLLPHRRPRIP